jgi:hypothetical protein
MGIHWAGGARCNDRRKLVTLKQGARAMAFAHLFSQRLLAAGASATTCSGGSMRASSDVQVARGGDVDEAKLRRGCIQKRSGIVKPSTNFKHWNDNVSRMYPECIPMYPEGCVEPMYPDVSRGSRSSERCIPSNVSRMYPENPGKVFFLNLQQVCCQVTEVSKRLTCSDC